MGELKQYKCLTDLRKIISDLESYRARPVVRNNHPTLYKDKSKGRYRTVMGIRVCDYTFSADGKWVLADSQMGLSFSATWENLKFVHGMFSRGKKSVDIYWMLSDADIPSDLKFVEDKNNPGHYFLTVTKSMGVEKLADKLRIIASGFSVITDGGRAL